MYCYCVPLLLSSTTYITCPADPKKTLGIKLPFLVMIIKNLKKYFTFEVQVRTNYEVRLRNSYYYLASFPDLSTVQLLDHLP